MTNFVTSCKFVKKGLSRREPSKAIVSYDEFSRTVGNIYSQSWLKQEAVVVDSDARPEIRKFLKQISHISGAKVVFKQSKEEEIPGPAEKLLSPDDTAKIVVMSKTEKEMQSVLVMSDPSAPKRTKIEEIDGNENGGIKNEPEGSVTENGSHAQSETSEIQENICASADVEIKTEPLDNVETPLPDLPPEQVESQVASENSTVDVSISQSTIPPEDAMPANTDSDHTGAKRKKSSSKKHKKEKKKRKRKSEETSEKKSSKTKSPSSSATVSHSKSSSSLAKEKVKSEQGENVKPVVYDPLDPASGTSRSAFPLPAGMDEGEILSDHSESEMTLAADISSFVETSPEQFASIVSSINKFYSTAVVDTDEYLTGCSINDANSDEEDLDVKEYDNLLIAGKVESEGDVCGLDIYIYNREEEELFVHHDYFLPAFPLAIEWLDYNSQTPNKKGSLIAVGTVKSEIEIWPIDTLGAIEPMSKLGAPRGILKNNRIAETLCGHSAAVTCLSWNHIIRKGLASGSVDNTVAFWDLEKGDCLAMFHHHEQPVSSVAFHPVEPYLLATAGFDQKVSLLDLSTQESCCDWNLSSNVEFVLWSALSVNQLYAAQANGNIAVIDMRFTDQVLYEFKAHEKGVTALAEDKFYPGCLVSVSEDSHLKLWNLTDHCPVCIKDKNMKMGCLSCVDSCHSNPFVYAVGGQSCGIRVVDFSNKAFSQFVDNTDEEL